MKYIFTILLTIICSFTFADDSAKILSLFEHESNITLSESGAIIDSPIIIEHISPKVQKPLIIGLALGGGATKGFTHIGVIKALVENGIYPNVVAGTSAGSLVGSLYAYGYTPPQLEKIAYRMDEISLADFTLSNNGVVKGIKLQNFVNREVKNTQLQNLKIPFIAVATDLDSGNGVGFNSGNTGIAVRASCSIPNVFIPVTIDKHRYVDGGLSAPVPVSYVKNYGANFIIAVDISAKPKNTKAKDFLSNLDQTINIMSIKLLKDQLSQANVVISPDTSNLSSFAFDQKKQAIDLGYKTTMAMMPQIKIALSKARMQIQSK